MTALARILSPRRIAAVVVVLLVAAVVLQLARDHSSTTIRATFTSGEGLYVVDDVKALVRADHPTMNAAQVALQLRATAHLLATTRERRIDAAAALTTASVVNAEP